MNIKDDQPMDTEISDLYQSTQNDGPSAKLDAAILAQAEAAVAPKRKRPAWIAPVGLAATVLLGVNLAVNLKDVPSAPDIYSEAGQSVSVPSRLPEPQVLSETEATSDDFVKDETSGARELAAIALSIDQRILAQSEENNESESASSLGRAESIADRDSSQMLRQISPARTLKSSIENQRQSERVRIEKPSSEPKELINRLAKLSDHLDASERQELSDASNSEGANVPRPASPRHDVTASVAAAPPSQVDSRSIASKPVSPAASYAGAETLPTAQTAPPAPIAQDESDSATEDNDIQEVVVTGTRTLKFNTSPYARPTAKNQAKRNEYRRNFAPDISVSSTEEAEVEAESVSDAPDIYVCDLEALAIDTDRIDAAKVDALNLEPPLNALSWSGYIRDLTEKNNYLEACTHLAAYQQMYPGIVMIELLPLTIRKQK